jgi:hypothetical protein
MFRPRCLLKRSANNNRRLKKRVSAVDSTPHYAELAMQCYKKIFGNTIKARSAAAENRGMDQCVCIEPNDQSQYVRIRESLKK